MCWTLDAFSSAVDPSSNQFAGNKSLIEYDDWNRSTLEKIPDLYQFQASFIGTGHAIPLSAFWTVAVTKISAK